MLAAAAYKKKTKCLRINPTEDTQDLSTEKYKTSQKGITALGGKIWGHGVEEQTLLRWLPSPKTVPRCNAILPEFHLPYFFFCRN